MENQQIQTNFEPNYWVTMIDNFFSGWGKANNKINKFVVACETYNQAKTIYKNANKRDEMKYVNICTKKPYYNQNYIVSEVTYNELGNIWKV